MTTPRRKPAPKPPAKPPAIDESGATPEAAPAPKQPAASTPPARKPATRKSPATKSATRKAPARRAPSKPEPDVAIAPADATAPAPTPTTTEAPKPKPGQRRIWISGATGFVGTAVARLLRIRGDEVIAPVRDRRRAEALLDMGVTVIEDDLTEVDRLAETMRDVDAVIHAAGSYRVGISKQERGAMWDANIGTTTRVLDAAEAARVGRIVYVSTVGYFGNTRGQVADESYRRNVRDGFVSWYDETKFGAHEVVLQRSRAGAPIIPVLPSQVYGPGDHSAVGEQLALARAGKLPYLALADVGLGWVHVDDLAAGIVAALDRGAAGRAYVLSGPRHRLRDALAIAARLGGQRLPRLGIPNVVLRTLAPVGRFIGQPSMREVVAAGAGVTYWASNQRAQDELDWHPRDLEDGLRDTFEALADRAYTR
jgi:dihydroflavonol-4-reductase